MHMNVAALTLLCLGFLAGFLLVLSFLEKPILPLLTAPHATQEHESELRWTHSQLQAFARFVGANPMLPVMATALVASGIQVVVCDYNVVAIFVAMSIAILALVTTIQTGPAMRRVRDGAPYEDALDTVSSSLFKVVRLHHNMALAIIPIVLAQLVLLFL